MLLASLPLSQMKRQRAEPLWRAIESVVPDARERCEVELVYEMAKGDEDDEDDEEAEGEDANNITGFI